MDNNENTPSKNGEYLVLARKYRPQNFDDLIGQEPMVRTLSNAFDTGRIAQAYMLTGVRGIGKTTTARILARALNYKTDEIDRPSVDLSTLGENCQSIIDGNHLDVIEMDAASHTGIDDIRDIIESAQYKPVSARYKVYIIDEVHMLSRNAFNGLLKTLEEPPAHLKFIFATTEIRKVPITVLSRCQRFDLRRIDTPTLSAHLQMIAEKEQVKIDSGAVSMIVRASEGSVRDAQSLMDQAIAHSSTGAGSSANIEGENVRAMLGLADRGRVIDLFEYLMRGDIAACLKELRDQYDGGAEPSVVLSDLAEFIHFVTRLKYVPLAAEDPTISDAESKKGVEFASTLSVRVLGRAWQILLKGIEEVSQSSRPLSAADMVLVRLAHAATLPTLDEVIKSVDQGAGKHNRAPSGSDTVSSTNVSVTSSSNPSVSVGTKPSPNSAPQMIGAGQRPSGPQLSIVPKIDPEEQAAPLITVNTFDELIYLAEDQRDLKIKSYLRRHIRLVNFENGRIEFSTAGNPPASFITDLQMKLKAWTGQRWNLIISREAGAPSLEEVEQEEEKNRIDTAKSDPNVEAILAKFPGAKVIDVRIRSEEITGISEEFASEHSNDEGLDDFFE